MMAISIPQNAPHTLIHVGEHPRVRPRRLRSHPVLRELAAETLISPGKLVQPIFVEEGLTRAKAIDSLPGLSKYPPDSGELVEYVLDAMDSGVKAFLIFATPSKKARLGEPAYSPKGPAQRALRHLRRELGTEPLLMADLCLCPYTDHGHCGVIARDRRDRIIVDNDATLSLYQKIAVAQAEAGVDVVAPSGMMDGQVAAIRRALDDQGFSSVAIMSYTAKYASSFYGPFREAASSHPSLGDRSTYQMDPRNREEALKEALLDLGEGADIIMVKPALAYLDVILELKRMLPHVPLAAYNVSGEYRMVKEMHRLGLADGGRMMNEVLTAIFRAGADLVITYAAVEQARYVRGE